MTTVYPPACRFRKYPPNGVNPATAIRTTSRTAPRSMSRERFPELVLSLPLISSAAVNLNHAYNGARIIGPVVCIVVKVSRIKSLAQVSASAWDSAERPTDSTVERRTVDSATHLKAVLVSGGRPGDTHSPAELIGTHAQNIGRRVDSVIARLASIARCGPEMRGVRPVPARHTSRLRCRATERQARLRWRATG